MEKQFIKTLEKYERITLYGAGLVGELTGEWMLSQGLQNKVMGYAVTKKREELDSLCGFPIYEIEDLKEECQTSLVLVTTMPSLHEEIAKELARLGFSQVIFVTEPLYRTLCKRVIADYNRQNPVALSRDAKVRLLFLASDNNKTSGAFLCMAELCEALQEKGLGVIVILPHYGTGSVLLREKKIPYTYIPSKDWGYETEKKKDLWERGKFFAGLLSNHRAKRRLKTLIKEQSVSLVHCNTTYTYIGAAAARACHIPYVWHLRENIANQGYEFFDETWALGLIGRASQVIAVSEYIKDGIGFPETVPVKVVYDPVEMDGKVLECSPILGRPARQDILRHFPQEAVKMLIVGAIAPFKGQRELIEACAILKREGTFAFHLEIVGKGEREYEKELEELVLSYGLRDVISFYGASSHVYERYAQADLSFTCGGREAYGRVTIEGQLSGCLVIGVNSGGTLELIKDGETGYLYEGGSPEALAERIKRAVRDPAESQRIARRGQEYALRTYTKERHLREILDIYEEVLEREEKSLCTWKKRRKGR
ncbi:MAG: glycosyltransferase family 4 protein [Lachnospiraceae bacterium]|jgi:glycosyltransferase involved in cell wall biosynthesis|nr:glycosyltransferase family 4 protein [Lachnospiraceae bacterium]